MAPLYCTGSRLRACSQIYPSCITGAVPSLNAVRAVANWAAHTIYNICPILFPINRKMNAKTNRLVVPPCRRRPGGPVQFLFLLADFASITSVPGIVCFIAFASGQFGFQRGCQIGFKVVILRLFLFLFFFVFFGFHFHLCWLL